MSVYGGVRPSGSIFSGASIVSVGDALASSRYIAPGVPAYDRATQEAADEIRRLASEASARRRDAKPVLLPHGLDADRMTLMSQEYPEYQIKPLMMCNPVSSNWQAHRFMAMNLCLDGVSTYSPSVVVLGNALFQVATRSMDNVHIELDSSSLFATHDYHESGMHLVSVVKSMTKVHARTAVSLQPAILSRLGPGSDLHVCVGKCSARASGMIIDLSTYAFSFEQAAHAMSDVGADVGMVFMPYSAEVFRNPTGVLCEASGVDYALQGDRLVLSYREGPAGLTSYRLDTWNSWLRTSTVRVPQISGVDKYYRLELMQTRGPFIYGRIVLCAQDAGVPTGPLRHALEMPWGKDSLLMSVSRLRSLRDDPSDKASWVRDTEVVSADTVRKLYEFALGLSQDEFSPEAVMKRAHVIDTRTVTRGVNLRIRQPMKPLLARDMSLAVYCKAFVTRYEMGRLSQALTSELQTVARFAKSSTAAKLSAIAVACNQRFWEGSFGSVARGLRDILASWYDRLSGTVKSEVPVFDVAPTFLVMDEYNGWYAARFSTAIKEIAGPGLVLPGSRGALSMISNFRASRLGASGVSVSYAEPNMSITGRLVDSIVDMSEVKVRTPEVERLVNALSSTHDVTRTAESRFELRVVERKPAVEQGHTGPEAFEWISDPAGTINVTMEQVFPGMHQQAYGEDTISMRFDPQVREFDGAITVPLDDPTSMRAPVVYKSRLTNYNVERKGQTLQETLTALQARTMSAPQMRVASDEKARVEIVWQRMKDMFMRSDAQEDLDKFRADSIGFERDLLREWGGKATPENIKRVIKLVTEAGKVFETCQPWEYEMMMKADAKPPMSRKPMSGVSPPQLIVMQDKLSSSMMSSIFRIIARRFVSLLRPEIMVNLLKSVDDIRDHVAANHAWGTTLKFLENDFGKFDKSQDSFSYAIMIRVCEECGFNQELLDRWRDANDKCTLHSTLLTIVLVVHDQNKSGGPATAFMNAVSNMSAVAVCYAGTVIVWAAFMGDDSLAACQAVNATQRSLDMMTEWFNFEAKFFVLNYPYFVSNFVLFDEDAQKVFFVPDPIKRCQKLSVSVSAVQPGWEDKFKSLSETLLPYRHSKDLVALPEAISERYGVGVGADLQPMIDALATVSADFNLYRSLYDVDAVHVNL